MKRYFINKMPDYVSGSGSTIAPNDLKKQIVAKAKWITRCQGTSHKDCDGGLYLGVAGVSYTFWRLSTIDSLRSSSDVDFLSAAHNYLKPAVAYAQSTSSTGDPVSTVGLLLGNSGVYLTAALVAKAAGNDKCCNDMVSHFAAAASTCLPVDYLPQGGDEVLVGRSGYLLGVLTLRRELGVEAVNNTTVDSILTSMVTSGREYSRRHRSPCPLMFQYHGTEYLGAAHGLSAILQVLLGFPSYLQLHGDVEKDVRESVDYLLSLQQPNGNFPCAMDEVVDRRPSSEELFHWCHGAPGVIYLMAKAYLHWKDSRYLESCVRCGDVVWEKGLLRKGPGICHGIAGSGYVFLVLYRLTKDERHLYRAHKFAEFLETNEFQQEARTPDAPYSLYEGWAGTLCFLADLLQPDKAHFPFFEIF